MNLNRLNKPQNPPTPFYFGDIHIFFYELSSLPNSRRCPFPSHLAESRKVLTTSEKKSSIAAAANLCINHFRDIPLHYELFTGLSSATELNCGNTADVLDERRATC